MAYNSQETDYLPLRDIPNPAASPYDQDPGSFSSDKNPAPFHVHDKKRRTKLWAWEWLALLVSLMAVIASAVTLRIFDGRAIPKWSWHQNGISVNSILSLLSTLSRASLLMPIDECMGQVMWLRFAAQQQRLGDIRAYSEATSGPLGSLRLLWRQRGIGLGCLGALLLIGSLGIGTAQQQLLSYPTRSFIDPTIMSTVKVAENFSAYQNITALGTTTPIMSYSLLSSIYSAAFLADSNNNSIAFEILPFFTCTSGTCTFDPFTTLAICSECHDTSDQVQSSCDDASGACFATFHNLTASSWQVNTASFVNTVLNQSAITPGTSSYPFTAQTPFTTLAHLQADSSNSWPPKYTGTQCALSWCAKTINATVSNGVYTESVVEVYQKYVTDDSSNPGGISITGPNSTVFRISKGAKESITGSSGIAATIKGWAKSTPSNDFRSFSSDLMQGFSSYANISEVMEHVASSLTSRIRNLDDTTKVHEGQTMGRQSFIRVRWQWLIYPVTLWTLSLIFLVCIAIQSRNGEKRYGMRAWGTNPLALMFYGMDDATRARMRDWEWEQMQDLSERLWVKLENGEEGVRLRGHKVDN